MIPNSPAELVWHPGPVCGPPRFPYDTVLLFKRPAHLQNGTTLCPYVSILRARDVDDTQYNFDDNGGEREIIRLAVWTIDDEAFKDFLDIDRCDWWTYLGPHYTGEADHPNEPFVSGRIVVPSE